MPGPQPSASAGELAQRIIAQLEIAIGIARAAQSSADAGDAQRALAILHDVEPALFEVTTLLNAVSLLRGNHQRDA
jgi:hypothetical protein